jgi:hypothetical protein
VPSVLLRGILQMLTFLINLYCPKTYHRPDHSIRIVEYHRKIIIIIIIISKPNIFTETRTQDSLCVFDLSSCNLLAETNNFVLRAVLLSCLVSELQKPPSPGLKPRAVFWSFDHSKIYSWFQGISMPSLVQIGESVLKL